MEVVDAVPDSSKTGISVKGSAVSHLFSECDVVPCKTQTDYSAVPNNTSQGVRDI
jgi:hypothetical protein